MAEAIAEYLHTKNLLSSFTADSPKQSAGIIGVLESLDRAQLLAARARDTTSIVHAYVVFSAEPGQRRSCINRYLPENRFVYGAGRTGKLISEAWQDLVKSIYTINLDLPYQSLIKGVAETAGRDVIRRSINSILESISGELDVSYAEALTKRLQYLFNVANEESDEFQEDMNIRSLRSFIDFLKTFPFMKQSDVVLTPEGNLRALWKRRQREYFKLEFLPTLDIKYFAIRPNEAYPEKYESGSGIATSEGILRHLDAYKIAEWAFM